MMKGLSSQRRRSRPKFSLCPPSERKKVWDSASCMYKNESATHQCPEVRERTDATSNRVKFIIDRNELKAWGSQQLEKCLQTEDKFGGEMPRS